jgi:ABC-type multidrug transport system ATPase subunit
MQIQLQNISKRYNQQWIVRDVNLELTTPAKVALLGINGSGKSTLLQMIAGYIMPSFGKIKYIHHDAEIPADKIFKYIGFCAPAMELIEEYTLQEFFEFHFQYKKPLLPITDIIAYIGLQDATNKLIENFSSGMKQRVKLAQSIMIDAPLILLDEPCSNLDVYGIALYQRMIAEFAMEKLVLVSSNDAHEYEFCTQQIQISNYK